MVFDLWNWSGTTGKVRVFASQSFYEATTGLFVPMGTVQNLSSACQVYDATVNGTDFQIPAITLATTTDSNVPNATYTIALYDSSDVSRFTMLSQGFVDPEFLQSPPQYSVLVADAGTAAANGLYTYRGQFNNLPYYNLTGQSDSTSLFAIINNGSQWRLLSSVGTNLYHSLDNTDFPYDSAWTVTSGSLPAPTVSQDSDQVSGTWEQLTISNQGFSWINPSYPGPFWNVPQIKEYVNSVVGDGTTPFASRVVVGKTELSADPVLSTRPIAVGDNDLRVPLNQEIVVYADSRESFQAAVTTVDDAGGGTVKLDQAIAITTMTVPNTITLDFEGGGMLTGVGGVVLTLETTKIKASPTQQIFDFADSAAIQFTKGYPSPLSPMWFGAVGDNVTDDALAFNQMTACQSTPSLLSPVSVMAGANIVIPQPPVAYYLSDTWNIYKPCYATGEAGAGSWFGTPMRWARNKCFIRTFAYTAGGAYGNQEASWTEFRNLYLSTDGGIAFNGNAVIPNGVANISGLTMTRVSGLSYTSAGGNYTEPLSANNTVRISTYDYIIGSIDSATQITLKKPRLMVVATNGSPVLSRADFAVYPTGADWAGQTIRVGDATYTILSLTTTTITLTGNFNETTGTYDAEVQTIAALTGKSVRFNVYHALDLKAQFKVSGVFIKNCDGNGINSDQQALLPNFLNMSSNTNNSWIDRVQVNYASGNALLAQGNDSSNMTILNLDGSYSGGTGYTDNSFLGNKYYAAHTSYNIGGAYRLIGSAAANEQFGCYDEAGQFPPESGKFCMRVGGVAGSGVDVTGINQHTNLQPGAGFWFKVPTSNTELGGNQTITLGGFAASGSAIDAGTAPAMRYVYDGGATGMNEGDFLIQPATQDHDTAAVYFAAGATPVKVFKIDKNGVYVLVGDFNLPGDIAITGDATVGGTLGVTGVTSLGAEIKPSTNDGTALGDTTHNFSDLFLAADGVINWNNGNVVLTQNNVGAFISVTTGSLRIATPGTHPTSVPTLGSTSTLTNKTLTTPVLTAPTATTIAIGSGTVITKVVKGTVTINPASINATTVSSQTFTLTGAATGDSLMLNPPAAGLTAGLLVSQYFVSAADTITVVFFNTTGAPIDEGSASWGYTLIRS